MRFINFASKEGIRLKMRFPFPSQVLTPKIALLAALMHVNALIKVDANEGEGQVDPMTPIMALNYCNFSLLTINEYNDRIILDQEYNSIINRINLSLIEDEEIIDIVKLLMDTLTKYQLNEGDKEFLDRAYEKKVEESLFEAVGDSFGNAATAAGSVALGAPDPRMIGQALLGVGGAYMAYRRNMQGYRDELDQEVWQLEKDAILTLNEANKRFIDVYWKLLKQYNAPDDWRLTQEQFQDYMDFIKDEDPARRHRKMVRREREYSVFPPYWYFRASAAHETANLADVKYCLDKYSEARKGFFRKDIIFSSMKMIEVAVTDYAGRKEQLLTDLDEMLFHDPNDARKRLFAAYKLMEYNFFDEMIPHLQVNFDNSRLDSLSRQAMAWALAGSENKEGLSDLLDGIINTESISNLEAFGLIGPLSEMAIIKRLWEQLEAIEISLDESLIKKDGVIFRIPLKWAGDSPENLNARLDLNGQFFTPAKTDIEKRERMILLEFADLVDPDTLLKNPASIPFSLVLQSNYGTLNFGGEFYVFSETVDKHVGDRMTEEFSAFGMKMSSKLKEIRSKDADDKAPEDLETGSTTKIVQSVRVQPTTLSLGGKTFQLAELKEMMGQ